MSENKLNFVQMMEDSFRERRRIECDAGCSHRWISVEEKLPKFDEYVLAYDSIREHRIACRLEGVEAWEVEQSEALEAPLFDVIAWMPLPAPPKL